MRGKGACCPFPTGRYGSCASLVAMPAPWSPCSRRWSFWWNLPSLPCACPASWSFPASIWPPTKAFCWKEAIRSTWSLPGPTTLAEPIRVPPSVRPTIGASPCFGRNPARATPPWPDRPWSAPRSDPSCARPCAFPMSPYRSDACTCIAGKAPPPFPNKTAPPSSGWWRCSRWYSDPPVAAPRNTPPWRPSAAPKREAGSWRFRNPWLKRWSRPGSSRRPASPC